jgi:hypothetical protein
MKRNVVLILSYYKAPAEHTQQQQRKFLLQYQAIRTGATSQFHSIQPSSESMMKNMAILEL